MDAPDCYLVLFNIAKKSNLGHLIRTANAFGVREVLIIGKKSYHEFGGFGTPRTTAKRHFYCLDEACDFLRDRHCSIVGLEIIEGARPIQEHAFDGNTAFMVGNEGTGLSEKQLAACDRFAYIAQFGTGASLNVNVAAGIALHHFASWAGYVENPQLKGKFTQPSG